MQQQKRELMSSYEALNAGLGLSPATGFVYMMTVNNWDGRYAHRRPEGEVMGLR